MDSAQDRAPQSTKTGDYNTAALAALLRAGWHFTRLKPGTKKPMGVGWQNKPAKWLPVLGHAKNHAGAVIGGTPGSVGLACLDIDVKQGGADYDTRVQRSEERYHAAIESLGEPLGEQVTKSLGWHLYYPLGDAKGRPVWEHGELIATGGQVALLPGEEIVVAKAIAKLEGASAPDWHQLPGYKPSARPAKGADIPHPTDMNTWRERKLQELVERLEEVEEGARHDTFKEVVPKAGRKGIPKEEAKAALVPAYAATGTDEDPEYQFESLWSIGVKQWQDDEKFWETGCGGLYNPDIFEELLQLAVCEARPSEPLPEPIEAVKVSGYPLAALGPVFEQLCTGLARQCDCSPVLVAQLALPLAAGAIQRLFRVEILEGMPLPVGLYSLTAGPTGHGKSAVMSKLGAPFYVNRKKQRADYAKAIDEWKANGSDKKEKPTMEDSVLTAADFTAAGLMDVLEARADRVIVSDEETAFDSTLAREDLAKLASILNSAFSGLPLEMARSRADMRSRYVPAPLLSVALATQPTGADKMLAVTAAKGLPGRILYAEVEHVRARWKQRDTRKVYEAGRWYAAMEAALAVPTPQPPTTLRLPDNAIARAYDAGVEAGEGGDGWHKRVHEHAARLAVVLHVLDELLSWQEGDEDATWWLNLPEEIPAPVVERATDLALCYMASYDAQCSGRGTGAGYGYAGQAETARADAWEEFAGSVVEKVVAMLGSMSGPVTWRDITRVGGAHRLSRKELAALSDIKLRAQALVAAADKVGWKVEQGRKTGSVRLVEA